MTNQNIWLVIIILKNLNDKIYENQIFSQTCLERERFIKIFLHLTKKDTIFQNLNFLKFK